MAAPVVVGQPRGAAVGGVRARDAKGLHRSLHGMAPAVVFVEFETAHMALGVAGGLELAVARKTQHMSILALSIDTVIISMQISANEHIMWYIYTCRINTKVVIIQRHMTYG
jgi:hypothetical protein